MIRPLPYFLRLASLFIVGLLLAGCLPLSVHPLHGDDAEIVFEEELLGRWVLADVNPAFRRQLDRYTFTRRDENRYTLIYEEGGDTNRFDAVLVRIDERLFLDLHPRHQFEGSDTTNLFRMLQPPMHTFLRIKRTEDGFAVALTPWTEVVKLLRAQPDLIEHELIAIDPESDAPETILPLFTSDPAELRDFVREHLTDERFYPKLAQLRRVQEEQ